MYKYFGILEADTIKHIEVKERIKKRVSQEAEKNYLKLNYIEGNSRKEQKWAVYHVRYSGPFLKWTREELKQMDQRTRKLRPYIPEMTSTDYMSKEKKEDDDLPTLRIALMQRYDSETTYKVWRMTVYRHQKQYEQHEYQRMKNN